MLSAAVLSRAFVDAGWSAIPLSRHRGSGPRPLPSARVCSLDFALGSSWDYARWVCNNFQVKFVHITPPTGTTIPSYCKGLRSHEHLRGLPHLAADDQLRVDSANAVFDGIQEFLAFLRECNIHFCVEIRAVASSGRCRPSFP